MSIKEATLSGEGPFIISNREELSSSGGSFRGSMLRRSLESVPRDSNKIFKVIDKAQVQHALSRQRETFRNVNISHVVTL